MPLYEYTCKECSKTFDHLARTMTAADSTATPCPHCGSKKTARALSVFAVGAEGAAASSSNNAGPTGCGRCGGPGPCGMG